MEGTRTCRQLHFRLFSRRMSAIRRVLRAFPHKGWMSSISRAMESSEPSRKPVKGKGIDPESARRNREERAVQIRKDKRFDRANIERRKFKTDDEPDSTVQSTTAKVHSYSILPQKCALLESFNVQDQLDGAMFFRRILAADKNPPLDLVIETGRVVPALIRFLSRTDCASLQIEAAWSLTNIACGEPRHIQCLIESGALLELLNVVATSKSTVLKDQALWAICNMTSVPEACEYALTMPNFMVLILQQVGLQCEIASHNPDVPTNSIYTTNDCVLQRIFQSNMKEFPTLSTMRHVTFIAGNIARLKHNLNGDWYHMILFAFSELVYSPDDEIVQDICACLITLIQEHPFLINHILELGLVSKMKENLESFNATTPIYELSLLVLCSLLRFGNNLHRQVVLGTHHAVLHTSAPLQASLVATTPVLVQCADSPHGQCSHPATSTTTTTTAPGASSSTTHAFAFPTANAFENPGVLGAFNFANAFGASASVHTVSPNDSKLPSAVLLHMIRHLERAEGALTKSDLCRGLSCVVDLHADYSNACMNSSLVATLAGLIAQDAYDLKVDAGELLCALVMSDGLQLNEHSANQSAVLVLDLLNITEPNLLVNAICAMKALFTYAIMHAIRIQRYGDIRDQVENLFSHPIQQIADLAFSLEDLVSSYADNMEDEEDIDDEY